MVTEIADETDFFNRLDLSKSDVPAGQSPLNPAVVLVDFWAPWCGPCVRFAPTLEQLASEYQGRVTIVKVNCDELSDLSAQFNVSALPTFITFVKGEQHEQVSGASRDAVERLIRSALAVV
jgi:thioredoxin